MSVAEPFYDQMIKCNPIIKPTELLGNIKAPDNLYTCKATEDNACCFQELKCIFWGTEAEVYVDEFNTHSKFCVAWKKLKNTLLGSSSKDILAAQLKKTVHNLCYNGPRQGFVFAT